MQVVTGLAKNRRIKAPRGAGIRPTSSLVRGAIFSIVESMGLQPQRVLDLYAGTGALGIEALSRGASHADFVERDSRLCEALRGNLGRTDLVERSSVYQVPVGKALELLEHSYDLVLLDPPYKDEGIEGVMERLGASGLVSPGGLVVLEHSKRVSVRESYGCLRLDKSKTYGDTCLAVYSRRRS